MSVQTRVLGSLFYPLSRIELDQREENSQRSTLKPDACNSQLTMRRRNATEGGAGVVSSHESRGVGRMVWSIKKVDDCQSSFESSSFLGYRKKRVSAITACQQIYSQAGDIHQTKKMSIAAPEGEERNGGVGYLPEKYTRIKWSSYEWVATAAKTGGKTRPFCTFGGHSAMLMLT